VLFGRWRGRCGGGGRARRTSGIGGVAERGLDRRAVIDHRPRLGRRRGGAGRPRRGRRVARGGRLLRERRQVVVGGVGERARRVVGVVLGRRRPALGRDGRRAVRGAGPSPRARGGRQVTVIGGRRWAARE